jgi:hypothetical protein
MIKMRQDIEEMTHAAGHHDRFRIVRDTLDHSNISVTNECARARPGQNSSG